MTVKRRFEKHEFQADYGRRSIQKLNETIESQKKEIHRAQADERRRRDQQLLHEQLMEQNRDLREGHMKSLSEKEDLKRFQGSTFDGFSRRKLIEDRDTVLELTAQIQELQNEVNFLHDSRDFKDAESGREMLLCGCRVEPVRYSDSDWPGDAGSRKSQSCGKIFAGGVPLNSFSRRQSVIATGTVEFHAAPVAEHLLLFNAVVEVSGLEAHVKIKLESSTAKRIANSEGVGWPRALFGSACVLSSASSSTGIDRRRNGGIRRQLGGSRDDDPSELTVWRNCEMVVASLSTWLRLWSV